MAAPVLQIKRGLFSNLPGLRAGEPGFTTDKYDLYVGIDSTSANNQFVGSGRFWTVETSSTGSGVNLVEGTSGTNYITLASPASLAGIVTYYLPGTQGDASSVLTNDGSGNLSWSAGSANSVLTGITTIQGQLDIEASTNISGITTIQGQLDIEASTNISGITTVTNTTDNTLGDADTGAFQIDGGLGVNKNVTVGGNLNVQGYSEFVGVVTFKGGTINLGDANTDDINVAGEFISSLVPNDDNSYDVGGDANKQWRHANFAGIGTFDGGLDVGGESSLASATVEDLTDNRVVIAGTGGSLEDDGNLTYNGTDLSTNSLIVTDLTDNRVLIAGTGGAVEDDANLTFDGSTLTVTGDASVTDSLAVTNDASVGSALTVTGAVDFNGGADISGGETTLSSATVSDLTSGRVVLAGTSGAIQDSGNLTFDGTTLTVTGAAAVDNVTIDGNTVSTSSGGLTLDSTSGTTTVADDLTVNGTLTVLGTQSIINTETLKVEDSLIELGLVNSGGSLLPPSSDANIDVGVLLHYYSGSAKTAAMFWDDSAGRIVVASEVTETTSVMGSITYAGFEIGSLWLNDCAGQSQVISCSGSTRTLENITVDGGSF
jgi:hypothetical protein